MNIAVLLFLFSAVALWGSGAVFDKIALGHAPAHNIFFARMMFTIICFFPLVLWKTGFARDLMLGISKTGMIYVVASVLVTNLGVYCYLKALAGAEASKIVPLSSVYPFVTVLLAILFLGEKFSWLKITGTALISLGVWCLTL